MASLVGGLRARPTPVSPSLDPAAIAERATAEAETRRLFMGGRLSTNPTGGLGDASAPNLAVKSLLGL